MMRTGDALFAIIRHRGFHVTDIPLLAGAKNLFPRESSRVFQLFCPASRILWEFPDGISHYMLDQKAIGWRYVPPQEFIDFVMRMERASYLKTIEGIPGEIRSRNPIGFLTAQSIPLHCKGAGLRSIPRGLVPTDQIFDTANGKGRKLLVPGVNLNYLGTPLPDFVSEEFFLRMEDVLGRIANGVSFSLDTQAKETTQDGQEIATAEIPNSMSLSSPTMSSHIPHEPSRYIHASRPYLSQADRARLGVYDIQIEGSVMTCAEALELLEAIKKNTNYSGPAVDDMPWDGTKEEHTTRALQQEISNQILALQRRNPSEKLLVELKCPALILYYIIDCGYNLPSSIQKVLLGHEGRVLSDAVAKMKISFGYLGRNDVENSVVNHKRWDDNEVRAIQRLVGFVCSQLQFDGLEDINLHDIRKQMLEQNYQAPSSKPVEKKCNSLSEENIQASLGKIYESLHKNNMPIVSYPMMRNRSPYPIYKLDFLEGSKIMPENPNFELCVVKNQDGAYWIMQCNERISAGLDNPKQLQAIIENVVLPRGEAHWVSQLFDGIQQGLGFGNR